MPIVHTLRYVLVCIIFADSDFFANHVSEALFVAPFIKEAELLVEAMLWSKSKNKSKQLERIYLISH